MKKISFRLFFLLALMAMVTMTFSACGGDDDDDTSGNGSDIVYIEPCFNWGASLEEVKAWMANKPFEPKYDNYFLYYEDTSSKNAISYIFDGYIKGLYTSIVLYGATGNNVLSSLVSQTEKRYNTTLGKVLENNCPKYKGNAVIGGRLVKITIMPGNNAIEVLFEVPE